MLTSQNRRIKSNQMSYANNGFSLLKISPIAVSFAATIGVVVSKVNSILPSFNFRNIESIKAPTGGFSSWIPFPPRSVFKAGGMISIASVSVDFSRCLNESLHDYMNAFVLQYT